MQITYMVNANKYYVHNLGNIDIYNVHGVEEMLVSLNKKVDENNKEFWNVLEDREN